MSRGAAARSYATVGVKECWLVLGPEQQIEVYRLPRNGEYAHRTLYGPDATVTSGVVPGFAVGLTGLFSA